MKDIIFQLDIRDMACLELSDGVSPFFSSLCKPVFLPFPIIVSFLLPFSETFCLNIGSLKVRQPTHFPYPYSAEAVASMIKAHILGQLWDPPAWLPKRYLTWATEA